MLGYPLEDGPQFREFVENALEGVNLPPEERIARMVVGTGARTIVVCQREIRGIDSGSVGVQIRYAVCAPAGVRGTHVQFTFQRPEERVEEIQKQAVGFLDHGTQLVLHKCAEYDWPRAFLFRNEVDLPRRFVCLVKCRDEWQSHRAKFQAIELRQQAVPHGFRGHASLVRDEKNGSAVHGSSFTGTSCIGVFHSPGIRDKSFRQGCRVELQGASLSSYILPFDQLGMGDVEVVGGKNASIGEMIRNLASLQVSVPDGFATTSQAYRDFLSQGGLAERIAGALRGLDVDDVTKLAETGARIRGWVLDTPFPERLQTEVLSAWSRMNAGSEVAVAVRSSATAEDLPEASFAGQQETFLNVRGDANLLAAMHAVYASLFNDRAIAYRVHHDFDHSQVALSIGVQHMLCPAQRSHGSHRRDAPGSIRGLPGAQPVLPRAQCVLDDRRSLRRRDCALRQSSLPMSSPA